MNSFYLLVASGSLLIVILAMNVSRLRYKERIAHGDRDNKKLRNAIIAHSNTIEHIIPYFLIIFVLVSQGTADTIINFLVVSFIAARVVYAVGITQFIFRAWQLASGFSYLLTIFASGLIIYNLLAENA